MAGGPGAEPPTAGPFSTASAGGGEHEEPEGSPANPPARRSSRPAATRSRASRASRPGGSRAAPGRLLPRDWGARRRYPAPGSRRTRCSNRPVRRCPPADRGCHGARRSAATSSHRSRHLPMPPHAWAGGRANPVSRARAIGRAPGPRSRPAIRPGRTGSRRLEAHPRVAGSHARTRGSQGRRRSARRPTAEATSHRRDPPARVRARAHRRPSRSPAAGTAARRAPSRCGTRLAAIPPCSRRRRSSRGGPPVPEVDDGSPVGRGAVPGRSTPGHRCSPCGAAHSFDVGRVGLHDGRVTASSTQAAAVSIAGR